MTALLASIPSPSHATVSLGPLTLHMYGLMLLIAIVACIALTGVRWARTGGDWELVFRCAVWGVGFGVVGARLYHIVTSWYLVPNPKWKGIFEVWQGGLGIWGGVLFGVAAGVLVVRSSGASVRLMMDVVAPGLLLAQGIGRLGNWWNQELFGTPTSLPWGLQIDQLHRPLAYAQYATFQPTFLYELIWDVIGVLVLLWIDGRFRIRRPGLFALYVSWYTFGRTFEELMRVDPSHRFLGERINLFVSAGVFLVSTAFFVWWQLLRPEQGRSVATGPRMAIPGGRVRRRH